MECANFHQLCTIPNNYIHSPNVDVWAGHSLYYKQAAEGGRGREEMASLPEIREMETKTEPKMTKLRNYKPQNIYTNGIITLDLINDAEICEPILLSF